MHCLSKPLWSAALHFFKVLACAMDAKLATLGPAGSLGIYIVKERGRERDRQANIQRDRYEGNERKKITSTSISQGAVVCL